MSPNPRHSIFILAMFLMPSVEAALYRCEAPDGSVVYQQTACVGETRGAEVQVDTRPPGGSSAGKARGRTDYSVESQLEAMESARERERKERQRDAKAKAKSPPRERDTRDAAACSRHRAEAARWRETIRNGYRNRDERDYQRHKLEYHQTLVRRYCGEG